MPRGPAKKKLKKPTAPVAESKYPAINPEFIKKAEEAVSSLEKRFGTGCVMRLGDSPLEKNIEVISSGSVSLDRALGVNGLPSGRVIEIYGPESCLAGETFLKYEVWHKGNRINHKGGTIRRLFERFHQQPSDAEPAQGRHLQVNDGVDFYVKSVDDEGRVLRNQVIDVVNTGSKPCYRVETETGEVLFSTLEHKYMTPTGFSPLEDLKVGDQVYVHNNTRVKGRKNQLNRPEVLVKYHPHLPIKIVTCKKTGKEYPYRRGQVSRMVYEAHLNDMPYEEYIKFLNTATKAEINNLEFLPSDIHVHHIDEDFTNNQLSNLQLIDPSEHGRVHAKDRIRNLSFVVIPSEIVDIRIIGVMDTYDLRCEYPYNNYIAEGIVVHNSGKTTLALQTIANAQKKGYICAFIDAEHALDIDYAGNLGVDTENLLLSQPECGEQALEIAEQFVSSGGIKIIVIDSVAALTPKAELEGEMGDTHVGLQARLMSQALRKLTAVVSRTGSMVIFINQIRMKIGVRFGSPETTTGGNALKFYASVRLDIRRIGAIKQGTSDDAVVIGNRTRVKVVKNKVAPPFRKAEFDIMYGRGVSLAGDVLDLAVAEGKVLKSGAWYSWEGERLGQGRENTKKFLEEHTDILEAIQAQLS